jgi:hypothetical protein
VFVTIGTEVSAHARATRPVMVQLRAWTTSGDVFVPD